jgi:hypothetical protein
MNMENKDFAVFILTHERSNNVKTYNTLKNFGYSGKIYFIVDNEDKTIEEYQKNYGIEIVKIFDKKVMADKVDEGNNFDERQTITHARNYCFILAKELSITYFIQLDDDYTSFDFRLDTNSAQICGLVKPIKNLDIIFDILLNYYKSINALSIAFAQGGDFIGGIRNKYGAYRFSKRKCMNSFICSTKREFQFVGAMNEDVNTYTTQGSRGKLFLTIPFLSLRQTITQSNKSGITNMYQKYGTYCKAFTSSMMHPSSVKVAMLKSNQQRIHHTIKWINTTPMIIDERYKKLV